MPLDDIGPTTHAYTSQRLRLSYVDWGNPEKPPLLLIHGGRDHSRNWDWTARALRDDWHVIAPDLRGHGDSAWSPDGAYAMPAYVYDIAQLVHQLKLAPVTIVAHSLGGAVALRYAGVFPEAVRRVVAIEGLGWSPAVRAEQAARDVGERWRGWIEERRAMSGRMPRRYPSVEAALERMREENRYLSDEQARHLTLHGVNQNEDGTYSWKFDNYVRSGTPVDLTEAEQNALWAAIASPVLLCWGEKSWASNPAEDGRAAHFKDARVAAFRDAGHWLHHDRFDAFLNELRAFL